MKVDRYTIGNQNCLRRWWFDNDANSADDYDDFADNKDLENDDDDDFWWWDFCCWWWWIWQ